MPIDEILFEAEESMEKAIDHLKHEFRGLRTGRATTALVEYVKVDYYGAPTDLRALASLTTPDASSIVIKPFDPSSIKDIIRGLEAANLGINPQSDGKQVRMVLPPLSGERRQQLAGKVKEAAEHVRISLRNIRRDANKKVDHEEKDSLLTEDQAAGGREDVQELLKKYEGIVETSVSSGAHSFPLWVRAKVLAEADPSAAASAQLDYGREVCRMLWHSRLAVLAASRAQILIERRRREHDALSRAVDTDPLTGLHNRRMFESWLLRPAPDAGTNTALLLVDVDDFKEVNDTFGHDCGDQVLRMVANLMASSIRAGDVAIRHGGDEFALLIEGDHLLRATVEERAEQLIAAIGAAPWSDVAPGLTVSVSIGVGLSARASAAELYKIADAALYRAKRARSRIALAQG